MGPRRFRLGPVIVTQSAAAAALTGVTRLSLSVLRICQHSVPGHRAGGSSHVIALVFPRRKASESNSLFAVAPLDRLQLRLYNPVDPAGKFAFGNDSYIHQRILVIAQFF